MTDLHPKTLFYIVASEVNLILRLFIPLLSSLFMNLLIIIEKYLFENYLYGVNRSTKRIMYFHIPSLINLDSKIQN